MLFLDSKALFSTMLRSIIAVIGGVAVTLSLAPYNFWPLAIFATACLFALLQAQTLKMSAWFGWCFGLGLFGSGASWVYVSIHDFGHLSVGLSSLLTLVFCGCLALLCALNWAAYALLSHRLITHLRPPASQTANTLHLENTILFAALWVTGEWARTWLLSGFPWLFIGYSQTQQLLGPWASIIGVYGISFLIAITGAVVALFTLQRKSLGAEARLSSINPTKQYSMAFSLLLIWLAPVTLTFPIWTEQASKPNSVTMVQANISQHKKWQLSHRQSSIDLYLKLTEPHWQTSDLIIWPEAAIPIYHDRSAELLRHINARAIASQTSFISGIPSRDSSAGTRYNSLIGLGEASGIYHKQKLVPFGEYIPFGKSLGNLLDFFDLPIANMNAGSSDQQALQSPHWQTTPLICYEVVYPALAVKAAAVSDVLITVSNDSWFGASIGPLQHLQMAQMRAIENQRYMLRSTGNGVTAIIDPRGRITARTAQFKQAVVSGLFFTSSGKTPWGAIGFWLVPSICGVIILLFALKKITGHKH